MSVRMVCLNDVRPESWKNGGGTTRSLVAWPDDAAWRVRVSVADIDRAGAFSSYAGVERWFCVLDGEGVQLVIDGRSHGQRLGDAPLRFDGASSVHATLNGGNTRDLNLMIARGHGLMRAVEAGLAWHPGEVDFTALFAWRAGRLMVQHGETLHLVVPAQTLVCMVGESRAPHALRFNPDGSYPSAQAWWLAATFNPPHA